MKTNSLFSSSLHLLRASNLHHTSHYTSSLLFTPCFPSFPKSTDFQSIQKRAIQTSNFHRGEKHHHEPNWREKRLMANFTDLIQKDPKYINDFISSLPPHLHKELTSQIFQAHIHSTSNVSNNCDNISLFLFFFFLNSLFNL
jgi:hypothetical protein